MLGVYTLVKNSADLGKPDDATETPTHVRDLTELLALPLDAGILAFGQVFKPSPISKSPKPSTPRRETFGDIEPAFRFS